MATNTAPEISKRFTLKINFSFIKFFFAQPSWHQPVRHSLLPLHLFNSLFSRTNCVSRHQKGKPFWILLEQEMTAWQITTPIPRHPVLTGRTPFLPPNKQRQSTEGNQWVTQSRDSYFLQATNGLRVRECCSSRQITSRQHIRPVSDTSAWNVDLVRR